MKYITVLVTNSSGSPRSGARIGVWFHRGLESGSRDYEYTDAAGEVTIGLDAGEFEEITISVDGDEKVKRAKVQAKYHIVA